MMRHIASVAAIGLLGILTFPAQAAFIPSSRNIVYLSQFGGVADGVTDNTAPIRTALSYLNTNGGGQLVIDKPGTYAVVPTGTSSDYFTLGEGVSVRCTSPDVVVKVLGSFEVNSLFTATDVSNAGVIDCTLYGNSIATGAGLGGAITFIADGSATGDISNFGAPGVVLRNFKQTAWIRIFNSSSHKLSNVDLDRLQCYSYSGNSFASNADTACIATEGQFSSAAGVIDGLSMRDVRADGTYLTSFYEGFNTNNAILDHGDIRNFGINFVDFTTAIHTVLSYEMPTGFDTRPHGFTVSNTYFYNSQENHIYCERTDGCHFQNNYLDTLSDIVGDLAEPPAATRFTSASGDISHNVFVNNPNPDIAIAATDGLTVDVTDNIGTFTSAPVSGLNYAVILGSGQSLVETGTAVTNFNNNTFTRTGGTNGEAFNIVTDTTHGLGYVNVAGGHYATSGVGLSATDNTGAGPLIASGISITGGGYFNSGLSAIHVIDLTTPLFIQGVTLDGSSARSGGYPLNLNGSTNIGVYNVVLQNVGAGVGSATDLRSTCGSVAGLQFHSATAGQYGIAGQPGLVAPVCTGQEGWFYQDLIPSGAGHLHGWTWTGAAWTED